MRMSEDMFGKDPAAPQFLVGFLRHILVERLTPHFLCPRTEGSLDSERGGASRLPTSDI